MSRTREHVAFAAVEHRAEHVTFKHLTGCAEVAVVLGKACGKDIITDLAIAELRKEIEHFCDLGVRVIDQTYDPSSVMAGLCPGHPRLAARKVRMPATSAGMTGHELRIRSLRAASRPHIARCAAEPAAIVPAELRLVAEPPLIGDLGDALPAVRITQHGVAHQETLVADVGAHGDAFSLKDLAHIPEQDAATVCHHLWREPRVVEARPDEVFATKEVSVADRG